MTMEQAASEFPRKSESNADPTGDFSSSSVWPRFIAERRTNNVKKKRLVMTLEKYCEGRGSEKDPT